MDETNLCDKCSADIERYVCNYGWYRHIAKKHILEYCHFDDYGKNVIVSSYDMNYPGVTIHNDIKKWKNKNFILCPQCAYTYIPCVKSGSANRTLKCIDYDEWKLHKARIKQKEEQERQERSQNFKKYIYEQQANPPYRCRDCNNGSDQNYSYSHVYRKFNTYLCEYCYRDKYCCGDGCQNSGSLASCCRNRFCASCKLKHDCKSYARADSSGVCCVKKYEAWMYEGFTQFN